MTKFGRQIISGDGIGYFKRASEARSVVVEILHTALAIVMMMWLTGIVETALNLQRNIIIALGVILIFSIIIMMSINRARAARTQIIVYENLVCGSGFSRFRLLSFALPYDKITHTTLVKKHPISGLFIDGSRTNKQQYTAIVIHSSRGKYTCYCDRTSEIANAINEHIL